MANSQKERVLRALRERSDGLTTIDLSIMCSTTRPANQILDLRRDGFNIQDVWINSTNRYGEPVRFVRYKLIEGDAND